MRGQGHGSLVAALAGAGVAGRTARELAVFLELLGRFGRVTNLRGPGGEGRALVDTLAALAGVAFLGGGGTLIDVGSGNGFPAIPILLAKREVSGVLLEPRERRWAFLCEVVRELNLNAEVRRERVEEHGGGGYDVLTCRGVAARQWVGEVKRLVAPGGLVMCWSGGERVGGELGVRVLPSPLSTPGGGVLHVWRRCFT